MKLNLDESLAPVSGDPARLQQVVTNLLTNAIKFTPEGVHVSVTVDSFDGRGRIRVADSAVGIEPDFLPHIFNRFSQEERGQTRTHGGLGLGLAIVRYMVEAHGGTVHAESAGRGMGATFTVSLPLMKHSHVRPRDEDGEHPGTALARNIKGVRVLVVEDDPGTREALAEMLNLSGAEVRSAESSAVAMNVFRQFRPDLLVCDIAMPDEDGYGLLGRIRSLGPDRGGDVPALALTALAGAEDRRRAFDAGFQVHMAKPVDIDRLVTALTILLKPPRLLSDAAHDSCRVGAALPEPHGARRPAGPEDAAVACGIAAVACGSIGRSEVVEPFPARRCASESDVDPARSRASPGPPSGRWTRARQRNDRRAFDWLSEVSRRPSTGRAGVWHA